jgi:putative DNA primase/helicase
MTQTFYSAFADHGFVAPSDLISDGLIHRFAPDGKGNKSAWYWLLPCGTIGAFGDWRLGSKHVWRADNQRFLSNSERTDLVRRYQQQRDVWLKEKLLLNKASAIKAKTLFERAKPASNDHPYLAKKMVWAHCAKVDDGGDLLLPIIDVHGGLVNIQTITSDGIKRFLKGGAISGCFIHVGGILKDAARINLAEGFATAATVFELTRSPTVSALNAGNLEAVAVNLKKTYPKAEIWVFADNDCTNAVNIGVEKAKTAARAVGGWVVIPSVDKGVVHGL